MFVPALAGGALVLSTVAGPALAKPRVDGTFPVSGVGTNNQITLGPDGNIWVTLDNANFLARIRPNGTVTEYKPAAFTAAPVGLTRAGQFLWATQNGAVVKVDPSNPDNAVKTDIADIADPRIITLGPDGNLWTASNDKVIKIPPDNPAGFTTYAATGVQAARAITRSGNFLWVADFAGQQIVQVTTAGVGTEYAVGGGPQGVGGGGPGGQVGYGNPGDNPQTVGRIKPGGNPQETETPNRDPFGVVFGTDNAFWFAQFASNTLGRLTTTGQYTELGGFPANSGPRQITAGRNSTLWVTLDNANRVARVTGVRDNPPKTTITKRPKNTVTTPGTRAKVTFRFSSNRDAAGFQCLLKRKNGKAKQFRPCDSPRSYLVKPGKYTFKVRAKIGPTVDATPAVDRFKVVRV